MKPPARTGRWVIAALAAAWLLALPVTAALAISDVNLLKVLAVPLARAKQGKLRVLIPGRLDVADFAGAHLYAAGGLSGGGYDIQLGAAPNCDGSPACFVAEFAATKGKLAGGTSITLKRGITGRYTPVACGASCGPASVAWLEYGARYTLWFGGGKGQLVALADAAIAAGAR